MTACEKKRPRETWRRSGNLASSFRSAALLRPLTDSKKKLGTDAKYIDAKFDYNQPTNDRAV